MSGFIIFVVLLILLAILAIIFYIFNKIEKFTIVGGDILFPPKITNLYNIKVATLGKNSRFNDLYVAMAEQYEEPDVNDTIYSVYSSFKNSSTSLIQYHTVTMLDIINNNIPDPSVAGLPILKLTPSAISANDYIFIELPKQSVNYLLSYIIITYDITNPTAINTSTNIFNIGTANLNVDNSLQSITIIPMTATPAINTKNSKIISYTYTPTGNSSSLFCNLILSTTTKLSLPIYMLSFQMYFIQSTTKIDIISSDTINILSGNPTEQITISLPSITSGENTLLDSADCNTIEQKYKQLLKLKIPWAIYDASKIDSTTQFLEDQLGRSVRKATISGAYTKKTDGSIGYIEGKVNTSISFPLGSCPRADKFTVCAITKYVNPTTNRKRILNGVCAIGHDNGLEGVITYDTYKLNKSATNNTIKSGWVVTCYKMFGKTVEKTIIINDEIVGVDEIGNYYDPPCSGNPQYGITKIPNPIEMTTLYDDIASNDECDYKDRLYINNLADKTYNSDFGLAYLMVWHTSLLDNEMLIVSKILNKYINSGIIDDTVVPLAAAVPVLANNDLGKTESTPAISAMQIKSETSTNTNGFYWIKPPGAFKAKKIFCIMDSKCEGGGWMLAMKASQGSTTFSYDSTYWTANTELVPAVDKDFELNTDGTPSIYMDTTQDAKYDIYNIVPVVDCLAIFNSREFSNLSLSGATDADIYTDPSNKQYGWRWLCHNLNNGNTPITLLDYFQHDNRRFLYTSKDPNNKVSLIKYMSDNKVVGGTYIEYNEFKDNIMGNRSSIVPPYPNLVWSYQDEYLSFGINCYSNYINNVRWGGSFNENSGSKPDSNDVSGGIGLQTLQPKQESFYCAGDYIGYMPGTKSRGVNKSLSFKWFIR